jgi:hypothetical protein
MRSACAAPITRRDFRTRGRERDRNGTDRERELAFAEQALGDDGRERGGGRRNQRVAEQNDAQQLVGHSEQIER